MNVAQIFKIAFNHANRDAEGFPVEGTYIVSSCGNGRYGVELWTSDSKLWVKAINLLNELRKGQTGLENE